MREFFRGWRRKVGGVTLGLACVFAGGWVRSLVIGDQVAFENDQTSNHLLTHNHFLTSKSGCLRWIRYGFLSNGINPSTINPRSIWTQVPLDSPSEPFDEPKIKLVDLSITEIRKTFIGEHYWHWLWQWRQFEFGNGRAYGDAPMFVWIVPYWSIVIPLTMFSAYLLLSKPRTAKRPAMPSPV